MFDHGVGRRTDGVLVAELVGTSVRLVTAGVRPRVAAGLLRDRAAERADLLECAAERCAARADPTLPGHQRYRAAAELLRAALAGLPY